MEFTDRAGNTAKGLRRMASEYIADAAASDDPDIVASRTQHAQDALERAERVALMSEAHAAAERALLGLTPAERDFVLAWLS